VSRLARVPATFLLQIRGGAFALVPPM